jgi:diaminopimelate decarboxylase (EC 4.1.1.20)
VGKTEEEISFALEAGIFMFNIESSEELTVINPASKRAQYQSPDFYPR